MKFDRLKPLVKKIVETDYRYLEAVIEDHYGIVYEICPMEEVGSSQYAATYDQTVKKGDLSEYQRKRMDLWLIGRIEPFILPAILKDLANKDIIPEGDYVIEVNW